MTVVMDGDGVAKMLRSGERDVVIAAPFIKSGALRKLLSALPMHVPPVTVVCRWLPQDIASGVCDLEIFEQIAAVDGARLLIHPLLHAKYYRVDDRCCLGSANLTARGLGWSAAPNLELLVEVPASLEGLHEWERSLLQESVPVTETLRDEIAFEVERLGTDETASGGSERNLEDIDHDSEIVWHPQCAVPEALWRVYTGHDSSSMSSSAMHAAQADLRSLRVPGRLPKRVFEAYVAAILRELALVREIDQLATAGLTDERARAMLGERLQLANTESADVAWRVLKRWLVHFLGAVYRLEAQQEVFIKGRQIPR